MWSWDRGMAFPSLSHSTPRESPTLATVSSLSDSSAIRQVVPGERKKARGSRNHYRGYKDLQLRCKFSPTYTCKFASNISAGEQAVITPGSFLLTLLSLLDFLSYQLVLPSHSLLRLSHTVVVFGQTLPCVLLRWALSSAFTACFCR